jgi:purine-nucleoside phosphorylase
VKTLIVTNAAGGLNDTFAPGDIMVISDHINLTGENPLVGSNADRWGARFPDMSRAYDPELAASAEAIARCSSVRLRRGIYAGLKGPSLETPAEIRYLRTIGADAVGFSTVMEVIAAVHAGMRVLGLSILTNVHNPDDPQPATLEEIIDVARTSAPKLEAILHGVIAGAVRQAPAAQD